MDLFLDKETGDLDLTNNSFSLVEGAASIDQHWRIRLLTWLGEWFLDQRVGIPYIRDILVKNPNLAIVRSVFHRASLDTPGIREIVNFTLEITSDRRLVLEIEGESEDLETFKFSFNEFILPQEGAAA